MRSGGGCLACVVVAVQRQELCYSIVYSSLRSNNVLHLSIMVGLSPSGYVNVRHVTLPTDGRRARTHARTHMRVIADNTPTALRQGGPAPHSVPAVVRRNCCLCRHFPRESEVSFLLSLDGVVLQELVGTADWRRLPRRCRVRVPDLLHRYAIEFLFSHTHTHTHSLTISISP
jgi:hypothetical protein